MNFDIVKSNNNKKKKILIILIIILFLVIAGVLSYFFIFKKEEPKKQVIKKPVPVKKLSIVNEDSNERPIAIMIDNNVGDKSHKGLQEAYITYEAIVEGSLSRIMVLYKDKDVKPIGPIRSSRHYFLDYALESDAIYSHFGWSPYARRDIKKLGVNNINGLYDSKPFWRVSDYIAPHNVFTSTKKLRKYAKSLGYKTETENWKLLNYKTDEINLDKIYSSDPNLKQISEISFSYISGENRSFKYDETNKYYLRFMHNNPHVDAETKKQYHYKNLIFIKVKNSLLDAKRWDLETTGTGEGYYLTNGYMIPITWQKDSRKDKTKYLYNGKEIEINDGNTFIEIVPSNKKIKYKEVVKETTENNTNNSNTNKKTDGSN